MSRIHGAIVLCAIAQSACGTVTTTTVDPQSPVIADHEPAGEVAAVTRVLDGDSFEATIDGRNVEVRLINVNAPERDECHGDRSRAALERLIGDTDVTLERRGNETSDRFGRLLRIAYQRDIDVNATMVLDGSAVALGAELSGYEAMAWAAQRGLWDPAACGAPPDSVVIADFEHDPPGPDDENAHDEWVEVENAGDRGVDVSGWLLRDESTQHRFVVPDGTTLAPGERLRVRSGCGTDRPPDLYWCARDPVWSNDGDTIILQNPAGNVADRVRYEG